MVQQDAGIEVVALFIVASSTHIFGRSPMPSFAGASPLRRAETGYEVMCSDFHTRNWRQAPRLSPSAMARRRNGDETSAFGCRSSPPSTSCWLVSRFSSLHPILSVFLLSARHTLRPHDTPLWFLQVIAISFACTISRHSNHFYGCVIPAQSISRPSLQLGA